MKKITSLFALLFLIIINGQTFKYGVTGNFHQGSIVGVHDVSKGNYGGALGGFIRFDRGFSTVYPNNDRNNTYNRLLAVGLNYYLNSNGW